MPGAAGRKGTGVKGFLYTSLKKASPWGPPKAAMRGAAKRVFPHKSQGARVFRRAPPSQASSFCGAVSGRTKVQCPIPKMSSAEQSKKRHNLASVESEGCALPEQYCETVAGRTPIASAISLFFLPLCSISRRRFSVICSSIVRSMSLSY